MTGPAAAARAAGVPQQGQAGVPQQGQVLTSGTDPAARLAFSDRAVGNVSLQVGGGDVQAARARLAGLVGMAASDAVFMEQVHGRGVAVVGRQDRGRGLRRHGDALVGVDALVTRDLDVALVVLVADCVPVLLVDPGQAVAAVHAGRRGVAAGVVPAVVRVLTDAPSRVTAVVGPAIGGCCYEVPPELADEVAGTVPAARATTGWGTPSLDLPAAVQEQLTAAGVGSVHRVGACTRCRSDRWFSHRADGPEEVGRHAGVVCRRASAEPDPAALRLPGVRQSVA